MVKVDFYDLDKIEDQKLLFAVIMARYNGKWIYVKHMERNTWEIPGGHRELGETINETAKRELFEETGAVKFNLTPLCIYSVNENRNINYTESFGELFYSEIDALDELPHFEINEIKFFDDIPMDLTYPLIQPFLHEKVLEYLESIP